MKFIRQIVDLTRGNLTLFYIDCFKSFVIFYQQ